jgi:hypothetical protein
MRRKFLLLTSLFVKKIHNKILVILFVLLSLFLTTCGNPYLEFNSNGIYETPKMRYELKQIDDNLRIKMTNVSGDTVMQCYLIFYYKDNDNETVATKSYISRPLYPHYWQSEETTVATPLKATKVYIRYNEYDYYGGPTSLFRNNHDYSYFSTIYMRLKP